MNRENRKLCTTPAISACSGGLASVGQVSRWAFPCPGSSETKAALLQIVSRLQGLMEAFVANLGRCLLSNGNQVSRGRGLGAVDSGLCAGFQNLWPCCARTISFRSGAWSIPWSRQARWREGKPVPVSMI